MLYYTKVKLYLVLRTTGLRRLCRLLYGKTLHTTGALLLVIAAPCTTALECPANRVRTVRGRQVTPLPKLDTRLERRLCCGWLLNSSRSCWVMFPCGSEASGQAIMGFVRKAKALELRTISSMFLLVPTESRWPADGCHHVVYEEHVDSRGPVGGEMECGGGSRTGGQRLQTPTWNMARDILSRLEQGIDLMTSRRL